MWLAALGGRMRQQMCFLLEVDRLKSVIRGNRVADGSRRENTAEHSWHLALFAMVLAEYAAETIDVGRVVRMLLLHDLVEIDAGDTPLFDQAGAATQAVRERAAADRIFVLLPEDQRDGFRGLWEEFEAAESADARFAKAIDRLQPILLNHAAGGGTWSDYGVDEQRERTLTQRIALGSPELWAVAEVVLADAVECGWLLPGAGPDPGSST